MYTEVPKLTRCCFCMPLRYGLLFWGYFKMLPTLSLFTVLILELSRFVSGRINGSIEYSVPPAIPILLTITIIDIIFSIVLLVAGHSKNWTLFRVYYYYSVTMTAVFLICYALFIIGFIVAVEYSPFMIYLLMYVIQVTIFGAAVLMLHIYITVLVRSEMLKLRDNSNFSFVNHASEAQCTMNQTKVIV